MATSTEQPQSSERTQPHPWIAERRRHGPHLTADERVGFNGRLGTIINKGVGTMWGFYLAAEVLGDVVQLLLMFVIMVGQQVIGAASDKRAVQTYKDAEAILHECLRLQKHLQEQDEVLRGIGPAGHPGRP